MVVVKELKVLHSSEEVEPKLSSVTAACWLSLHRVSASKKCQVQSESETRPSQKASVPDETESFKKWSGDRDLPAGLQHDSQTPAAMTTDTDHTHTLRSDKCRNVVNTTHLVLE